MRLRILIIALLLLAIPVSAVYGSQGIANPATESAQEDDEFVFGMILVGPRDDRGWNQAHYEGGLYVEENVPGARMILAELINPDSNPDLTFDIVVEDMVDQGAEFIIANSDEYRNDVNAVAPLFPDVTFLHISGDAVLTGEAPPNVTNMMAQMEYGKMIAGCVAALTTETGQISYLGPLINDETRRLTVSAYLGAEYCYEEYRGLDAADLSFEVIWIGYWFEIPGLTLNPTEVTNSFFDGGTDVVISGIDTTEAIVVAGQRAAEGEPVTAIPYDFIGACELAPEVCLGTPYFNWGPDYVELVNSLIDGSFEPTWEWIAPEWDALNDLDASAIGYIPGEAISEDIESDIDLFISMLAESTLGEEGGLNLWSGPLILQDGTEYVAEGEVATLEQVWYMPQLLQGMEGQSEPE